MPQLAFLGASALASLLPEGHMASLFYAERLLEFPLGVLGAAVGMAAAPRLAELAASEGLSRSSRSHEIPSFSLSQPQKPEQARSPAASFRFPYGPQRHQGDTRRPLAKSLGMVKGWRLRMENPFSKEGSPPRFPLPFPKFPADRPSPLLLG